MKNLHLIIGENKENIAFYLQNILDKINTPEENIIRYDLNESSLSDILDEASMISLFSNIKVIIGDNFNLAKLTDDEIEYLTKYIDNSNKDTYIILITNKIDGRLKIYKLFKDNFNIFETDKINNSDNLYEYIKNKVKDNKYQINNNDIDYLLTKTGFDINNINSELNKLFIYKCEDKIINRIDIELLVQDSIDSVIYEFTNAFLENDLDKITKMYHDFKIENIGFDYIVTSLSNVLRQSLIIKILSEENKSNLEISKILGKKEFFVKKMLERLYQYTVKDLANYITKLATIDDNYKSGKANIDELGLFLINKDYNVL